MCEILHLYSYKTLYAAPFSFLLLFPNDDDDEATHSLDDESFTMRKLLHYMLLHFVSVIGE